MSVTGTREVGSGQPARGRPSVLRRLGRRVREAKEKNWPEVHAAFTGGVPSFVMSRSPERLGNRVPVFCYHVIGEDELRRDLSFLRDAGYSMIDADELLRHLELGAEAPRDSVVLSFDDGALNLYRVVFPLLRAFQAKAVAFICPGLHEERLPPDGPAGPANTERTCTWSEIEEMHESGLVDFQGHTYFHRYVPRWPEPIDLTGVAPDYVARLRSTDLALSADLARTRTTIERKLSKRVRHLAFPKYQGTEWAIQEGLKAGFQAFWWGALPYRPLNEPGQSPLRVARWNDEWVRRLPGEGRSTLLQALKRRFA